MSRSDEIRQPVASISPEPCAELVRDGALLIVRGGSDEPITPDLIDHLLEEDRSRLIQLIECSQASEYRR